LEEYPHRKSQVKIISHSVNKGSAAARQTGIDNATGDYTIYLDSDDWVEPGMIEQLYESALNNDSDIVICDYYLEFPKRQIYSSQPVPPTGKELVRALISGAADCSTCNKLIRKSLYVEHNVRFSPNINMFEDLLITVKLSWYADRVNYLPKAFLHYCKSNPESQSTIFSRKALDNVINGIDDLESFIKGQGDCIDAMAYRKLYARLILLMKTRGTEQKRVMALYPDIPRSYILRQPNIAFPNRLAHYFASLGWQGIANLIFSIGRKIKEIIRY
jgi:glycosyltransferase involved in cell wall biosynthesis